MMPDALIQKPMASQDMGVLLPPVQVQNTGSNTLKDSSLKDGTLVKSPSKTKQLNIAKPSGKGVLEMLKITPGPPNNLSPEIMGSKSLSSTVGHKDYDTTSPHAISNSRTPQPPNSAAHYRNDGRESSMSTDSHSEDDSSSVCESGPEGTTTLTTGPLVEFTGTYTAVSPTSEHSAQWSDGSGERAIPPWTTIDRTTPVGTTTTVDQTLPTGTTVYQISQNGTNKGRHTQQRTTKPHTPGVTRPYTNGRAETKDKTISSRHPTNTHKTSSWSKQTSRKKHTTNDSSRSKQTAGSAPGGRKVGSKPSPTPSKQTTAHSKPPSKIEPPHLKSNEAGGPQHTRQGRPTPKPRNVTSSEGGHGAGRGGKK